MGMKHKSIVVGAGHADVHIVVPGDEALVTDGTQHGACPTVILDVVLTADTIYRQQNLQDVLMEGFYIVAGHNSVPKVAQKSDSAKFIA
jgi:hypothetical protein